LLCCGVVTKDQKVANTPTHITTKPPSHQAKPTSQQANKPPNQQPSNHQARNCWDHHHTTQSLLLVSHVYVCACVCVCARRQAVGFVAFTRRRCWAFSLARRVVVGDLLVVAPMEASLCWYFRAARSCCRHSSCWFSSASAGRSLLCGKKCAEVESWVSAGWRKLRAGFPRTKQTNKKNKNSLASNSLLFFRDETTEGMLGEERFGFVRERLHEKGK
jgi:hypothetical protein